MTIKDFLEEVRFKTYVEDTLIPFDRSEKPLSTLVVQLDQALKKVQGLKESTEYSINSLNVVRRDAEDIFKKINDKISMLDNLAEGYQYLNTNELDRDLIHGLKVFNLKDIPNYNDITKSVTLPRLSKARFLKPSVVQKNNLNAEEVYKITGTYRDSIVGIVRLEHDNTELLKADFLNDKEDLLETALVVDGRITTKLSEDVKYIKVYTNNIEKDRASYTTLSILDNRYDSYSSVILGEGIFEKKGDLLKIILDAKVPTESFLILDLKISYKNMYTDELEEYNLTINSITSRYIIVERDSVKGKVLDLNGNEVDSNSSLDDYVMIKEVVDDTLPIQHLGNRVFDVKGIKSNSFKVTLKGTMYNTIDNTKTPEVKGIFAYVTER